MIGEIAISDWGDNGILGGGSYSEQLPADSTQNFKRILGLFLVANLWTLVMTAIPVVTTLPSTHYYNHDNWYTGDDIMRFIEPVGGTLFQFFVLFSSGIFKENMNTGSIFCVALFLLGLALYGQGAGFHSASNMFKNALQTIQNDENDDRLMQDLYYYMRVVWEHAVSHYIYAAGYAIMNIAQFHAFRMMKAPYLGLTKSVKALLVCASIIYALLVAGVAVEFPSGTIVGFIYLVLVGFGYVGGFMISEYRSGDREMFKFGQRPIVHYYLLSYILALIIVIAWMCAHGIQDRSQAGVA